MIVPNETSVVGQGIPWWWRFALIIRAINCQKALFRKVVYLTRLCRTDLARPILILVVSLPVTGLAARIVLEELSPVPDIFIVNICIVAGVVTLGWVLTVFTAGIERAAFVASVTILLGRPARSIRRQKMYSSISGFLTGRSVLITLFFLNWSFTVISPPLYLQAVLVDPVPVLIVFPLLNALMLLVSVTSSVFIVHFVRTWFQIADPHSGKDWILQFLLRLFPFLGLKFPRRLIWVWVGLLVLAVSQLSISPFLQPSTRAVVMGSGLVAVWGASIWLGISGFVYERNFGVLSGLLSSWLLVGISNVGLREPTPFDAGLIAVNLAFAFFAFSRSAVESLSRGEMAQDLVNRMIIRNLKEGHENGVRQAKRWEISQFTSMVSRASSADGDAFRFRFNIENVDQICAVNLPNEFLVSEKKWRSQGKYIDDWDWTDEGILVLFALNWEQFHGMMLKLSADLQWGLRVIVVFPTKNGEWMNTFTVSQRLWRLGLDPDLRITDSGSINDRWDFLVVHA